MAELSDRHVTNTLKLLADVAADQAAKYDEISADISDTDSDDDYESSSPVFDSFYSQGKSATILQTTNFDAREFHTLWMSVMHLVQAKWELGMGRKTKYTAKDPFFMVLVTVKNGETWDFLARLFHMIGPTFDRLVTKFVVMFSEPIYVKCVLASIIHHTMLKLVHSNKCFKHFPTARYATDVTFQQSNRPSGSIQEGKKYYSGKHKLYGYKVEVSVLPNGIAVNCTDHYPGSVADIDIFYKNSDFHEEALAKTERDVDSKLSDTGPLHTEYPDIWALLVDKGYQGARERIRAIHPKRKPKGGSLTLEEIASNKTIASHRIIVENWFGRHCTLWSVCSNKWKWSKGLYDSFFAICAALTNRHICLHPLRADDVHFFRRLKQRLYIIVEEIVKKRKKVQERYRLKRKRRLAVQLCSGYSIDETTSP